MVSSLYIIKRMMRLIFPGHAGVLRRGYPAKSATSCSTSCGGDLMATSSIWSAALMSGDAGAYPSLAKWGPARAAAPAYTTCDGTWHHDAQ